MAIFISLRNLDVFAAFSITFPSTRTLAVSSSIYRKLLAHAFFKEPQKKEEFEKKEEFSESNFEILISAETKKFDSQCDVVCRHVETDNRRDHEDIL